MTTPSTAIVTTTDRSYLPPACCQLASVVEHLPNEDAASLNLIACDVSQADIDEARRFFDDRSMAVRIMIPDFVDERVKPINEKWPRAAYLRLYFDMIFDDSVDRIVYFDADTRVLAQLQPLLDVDLDEMPIGAVHDFIYYVTGNIRRRRRDLFLKDDAPYLQSGVMVFDWKATLAEGGLERARRFLLDHPERCQEAPDQDALNAAFEGRWKPLDPRWNLHELYLMFGGKHRPYIEHYTSTKPWSRRRPAAWQDAAAWYAHELADTAWSDFVDPQSVLDSAKAQIGFLKFRYAPKVRDGLARYAPVLLDIIGVERVRDESMELPWAPRNGKDVEDMTAALIEEAERHRGPIRPPESVLDGYAA